MIVNVGKSGRIPGATKKLAFGCLAVCKPSLRKANENRENGHKDDSKDSDFEIVSNQWNVPKEIAKCSDTSNP
jgi:hypothetical protein